MDISIKSIHLQHSIDISHTTHHLFDLYRFQTSFEHFSHLKCIICMCTIAWLPRDDEKESIDQVIYSQQNIEQIETDCTCLTKTIFFTFISTCNIYSNTKVTYCHVHCAHKIRIIYFSMKPPKGHIQVTCLYRLFVQL